MTMLILALVVRLALTAAVAATLVGLVSLVRGDA